MDSSRIQREFADAQKTFAYLELHPTTNGKVFAKTALQADRSTYVLSIKFPENYPNEMPRVFVDAPAITTAPHMYQAGNICYLHPSMWNPGVHNLKFVIARAAKWLNKYEVWRTRGKWPGAEIKH
ncbi:MAG TPA: ubiquitin-conjugating enzyme E2 [Pyrinomonadaceae bacterium]|nr:ubiquitin-conjugating enzyme E2 [Pyrinomonadaceae bacterium]